MVISSDKKECCGKECIEVTDECPMDGSESITYICPYCGDYYKEEGGWYDAETVCNMLGINPDDIKDFATLSEEELGKVIRETYEEMNK